MIVTKSTYAQMRHRSPAAVSNWIKGGKLTAPALVECNGRQLVDVDAADAQLSDVLDPAQQLAQSRPMTTLPHRPYDIDVERLFDARTAGELQVLVKLYTWLPILADRLAAHLEVDKVRVEKVLSDCHAEFLAEADCRKR